ncbi:ABC transporter G family member 31 [Zea mays]|uniref:ABC transporter G family member 31 n=1 Tax=Zea mays TaxID=4577 RepID=A0A3L6FDE1_MAIZE|nr:ABC transporter G family member 31 [Zea mays]
MWAAEAAFSRSGSWREAEDEREALRWAALQRLPTVTRARRGLLRSPAPDGAAAVEGDDVLCEVDVAGLSSGDRTALVDRLVADSGDSEHFFRRIRSRFDAVQIEFPKIEVRYEDVTVDAYVHVGSRALPTIPNFICNMTEAFLRHLRIYRGGRVKLPILDNISGMSGNITYNGHHLNEFVPQRTSAYVSQQDWHASEMTVRETLEFAGRCQGVGIKYGRSPHRISQVLLFLDCLVFDINQPADMLVELLRREKNAGIKPDEDLDVFMKALALEGKQTSLVAEYIMKILGLDVCADTIVGDEMIKGISGGQKKRLTTGELLVGSARVLFMDEISTGLDSATTYQIIKYLRNSTHALDGTTIISLLQPAPETYELFDDVILIAEGQIVYQGPREYAVDFFGGMGFRCPERKNVADFLQEVHTSSLLNSIPTRISRGFTFLSSQVLSKKDQQQYWCHYDYPYQFVSVSKFAEAFKTFIIGKRLHQELTVPYNRHHNHPAALCTSSYGVKRLELLKSNYQWQRLLMKRNSFIYVFKFIQLLLVALITMTVFFRSTMHHDSVDDGIIYLGALYFAIVMILFNGFTEVSMLVTKLPVLYKHRDLHFYPPWAYTLPSWLLSIPTSLYESGMWVLVTYYVVGYDPQFTRFLGQFLLLFFLHQTSLALFRVMASLGRNMIVANTFGSFALLVVMILGGFIITKESIPVWWIWGYWVSPMMYAQNAISVNEFHGHSWNKQFANQNITMGEAILTGYGLFKEKYWFWIGVGALFGYAIILNILFTMFLTLLNPIGNLQAVVPKDQVRHRDSRRKNDRVALELRSYLHSNSLSGNLKEQKGMVLPFQPLSMCFRNINYYVDVPVELKKQGVAEDRLQLLVDVTGAFRPGILTALVGVSGAGKTTLMDVLAGRKTGGLIEGSITISGYPKNQETFTRISGYCEQNDVHSPCLTVIESLLYSACLRLPSHVDADTQRAFVEEVMELVELNPLSGALVGLPGVNGLSTEQRKRLTIAVELVANPSIVFMDEPTSGLDARSAAIVMRTVRNIVNTGRTIVCTIHQPSIDIFESFDELLFMKRGGQLIYAGPLGAKSRNLVDFFEAIPGVPKIRDGYNPAAWIQTREIVEALSRPSSEAKELTFATKYAQPFCAQYMACLWKHNLSYWRNPQYTAVRFFYTVIISLMFGTICWKFGSRRGTQHDIFNAMGAMYAAVLFIGITNATSVQPVISIERFVSYRERAAGMYSALPFAFSLVTVEFPYILVQSLIYGSIFYSLGSFEWTAAKFLWYLFFMYFTLLYFTFYGMMTTAITPNHTIAPIIAAPFYTLWNLFCGFMIPRKRIPVWWRWYYWANPVSWTLYGLLTSQFGDLDQPLLMADGVTSTTVVAFLEEHFGFRHDFLGAVAAMVAGFCVLFAVVFALAIKYLNFQRR